MEKHLKTTTNLKHDLQNPTLSLSRHLYLQAHEFSSDSQKAILFSKQVKNNPDKYPCREFFRDK